MRRWLHLQYAACVYCWLCLHAASASAIHASGQSGLRAGSSRVSADSGSLKWLSNRLLLSNDTTSTGANSAAAAAAPARKPTILQAADVTFRLVGTDAFPFSNATAKVFQQALNNVFSNFSYAAFQYQSAMVNSLL